MSQWRAHRSVVRRGYTLIELLIVVAVLGLAGALLVPHLVDRDSFVAQAATRQVIADLHFAQSDALAHQGYRRVHFYDDGSGYCIVRVSASDYAAAWDPDTADYVADPLGSMGNYIVNFPTHPRFEDVTLTDVSIDGGGLDVIYDPLGGTIMAGGGPGSGGTLRVTTDDHTYELSIAPFTGKLTVTTIN